MRAVNRPSALVLLKQAAQQETIVDKEIYTNNVVQAMRSISPGGSQKIADIRYQHGVDSIAFRRQYSGFERGRSG